MGGPEDEVSLELQHIDLQVPGQRILTDVCLEIREREIVSLIGPNGAGKTTLFNVVCGQIRAGSGRVIFRSQEITGWAAYRICRAGIARTFQIARPFPEMTAEENVRVGLWFGKERPTTGREARELLDLVDLGRKADTAARELTLSELRRLEVARALATHPHLILLDEIAAGLSPQAIQRAVELLRRLRERGLTVLLIDHFLTLTAKVSDRLIALCGGRIIAEGSPDAVLRSPAVVSAYLGQEESRKESPDAL